MTRQHAALLRVVVAALAAGAVLAQLVVVPAVAAACADRYPEVAHLELPYLVACVAAIGGFEVALLAAWQLVSAAEGGGGLTRRSRRWADGMAASLGVMAVLLAGVCAHAVFVAHVGGPPVGFGLLASLALVAGAVVLRNEAIGLLVEGVRSSR